MHASNLIGLAVTCALLGTIGLIYRTWSMCRLYRSVLEALPMPVWVRGNDLSLRWANKAFTGTTDKTDFRAVIAAGGEANDGELQLAGRARDGKTPVDARRHAWIHGRRRSLSLSLVPLGNTGVVGFAIDTTGTTGLHAALQADATATAEMLNAVPAAMAIFDRDQRLVFHNSAYAAMWKLGANWLGAGPTLGEILDRLRETRMLPEQRDFISWKRRQLRLFENGEDREEYWHLSRGLSVRVLARRHPSGGIFFVLEDVSDRLRLEAHLGLLTRLQRATLDVLHDGVAVFGADGRLLQHNSAFAEMWKLAGPELTDRPHLAKLAVLARSRTAANPVWDLVESFAAGGGTDPVEKVLRFDDRIVSLSMARLPEGATAAVFSDQTDLVRFEIHRTEEAAA